MLVLSRRPSETVVFPGTHISVHVVSIKSGVVRLGIEAPPDVTILRAELQERDPARPRPTPVVEMSEPRYRALRHFMRNRLNGAAIGLALLRKQLSAGTREEQERTIGMIDAELQMLRQQVDGHVAAPTPAPAKPSPKPRRALLVEDDDNERELLAGFLRLSGFAVDTAGDGCDALDRLRNHERPDVVLLDMGLPRCDGATTAREIRRDPTCANMRIFAVTGHSPDEYGFDQGPKCIDRWFHKPLDPVALLRDLTQELGAN